jgi:hypothetical protein
MRETGVPEKTNELVATSGYGGHLGTARFIESHETAI